MISLNRYLLGSTGLKIFLLELKHRMREPVNSSHRGRGTCKFVVQRLSPVQGRPARHGGEATGQEAATFAARGRLKQLRRLEHVLHLLRSGSNPALVKAVWRRFRTHGVKLFLPQRELTEQEAIAVSVASCEISGVSVESALLLHAFILARHRACIDAERKSRAARFREALNAAGTKQVTKDAWRYVRQPRQQEMAFLQTNQGIAAAASDINQALCDLWFPFLA